MGLISETQKEDIRRQISDAKSGFEWLKLVDPEFYREIKNELFPEPANYFIAGRLCGKTEMYTAKAVAYLREINSRKYGIKDVIFNDPATVVMWEDGSKTVVKRQPGDTYNRELGLAMCICKKHFGNKGNYNEVFKKYIPEELPSREKLIDDLNAYCFSTSCERCLLYNGEPCKSFVSRTIDELRDAYKVIKKKEV